MLKNEVKIRELPPLKDRLEMAEILQKEVYGYLPSVQYEMKVSEPVILECRFAKGKVHHTRVQMEISANGKIHSFAVDRLLHVDGAKRPLIIYPNFHPMGASQYFPIEELAEYDADYLVFCYKDVSSDDGDMQNGLGALLLPEGQNTPHTCGKIGIWAWAAQRVLDYGLTLPGTDAANIGVAGHSRLGKTALFCAMTDERFKYAYSNASGCAGAALARGNSGNDVDPKTKGRGETYYDIYTRFPFWFCPAFEKYTVANVGTDFDQHYLLATIAPRFLLVGSCSMDGWADPISEQLACVAASEKWEADGITGACFNEIIAPDNASLEGRIGYFKLDSQHFMSRHGWRRFIEFIELHKNEPV